MLKNKHREPSQDELNRLLKYNPITGELTWKKRAGKASFNTNFANKPAGTIDNKRMRVKIGDKLYYASRLIYIMHHGKIPKGKIVDHINGNTLSNKLSNLRLCSYSQNSMNRKPKGELGLKGVTRFKGKFMSRAYLRGNCHYLGLFDSPMEAAMAYDNKVKKLHGEFATLNFS